MSLELASDRGLPPGIGLALGDLVLQQRPDFLTLVDHLGRLHDRDALTVEFAGEIRRAGLRLLAGFRTNISEQQLKDAPEFSDDSLAIAIGRRARTSTIPLSITGKSASGARGAGLD